MPIKSVKLPFAAKFSISLFSVIALVYLLWIGKIIIAPFFLAFLLALLFLPFADFLERRLRFPRGLSSLCAVSVILLLLMGLGYFFGTQLSDFSQDIPQLQSQFNDTFQFLQEWMNVTFNVNAEKQFDYLDMGMDKLLSSSGQILSVTFDIFTSSLAFLLFFIFFFIFILNYRRVLNSFIVNVFAEESKEKVREVVSEVRYMTKSYMFGLCIQIFIVSVFTSFMLMTLGVKYALLLGILTGLLNVIPYIGILTSLVISSFIAFATAAPITSLYVVFGYLIIHAIDGNIILPFVVGSKVKINALFSFLGIIIGERLWGISGMLLCIPALAIIKIIFNHVDSLKPWALLLGENIKPVKKKRKIKITKKITIEEKD